MVNRFASASNHDDGQLALSLPRSSPRYDRGSYTISDSNDAAWRCVNAWLDSEEPAMVICGPPSSGKTHLAHIAAERFDGVVMDDANASLPEHQNECVAFDNLPAGSPREFLTLIEERISAGGRVILVGNGRPGDWSEGLLDLRTRIEAMPRATLNEPDEALMRIVIAKSFQDRQIVVDQRVIDYAAPRLPRTFSAAQLFVTRADKLALEKKRKISTTLAQKIINDLPV